MKVLLLSVISLLLAVGFLFPQSFEKGFGLGLKVGMATSNTDIEELVWKPHFGLAGYYWLTDLYAIGVEAGATNLEAQEGSKFFKSQMFYLSSALKFKLIKSGPIRPYILAGVEGFKFDPKDKDGNKLPNNQANSYNNTQFGCPLGGGLSLFMSDNFSLDFQGIYHLSFTDYLDDLKAGGNDAYITTSLKLTIYFGVEERDTDGDGIPDKEDKCPNKKEDFDGFEDLDGCPDLDNDRDGVPDALDKCPNKMEDIDGFKDKDGCPDPDNDEDGIPDKQDKCPGTDETVAKKIDTKEDMDGFQDEDGCPDVDNDEDGIPDVKDKCPNKPETFNGWEDEDGCPDSKPKVKLETGKAIVLKGVFFQTGSMELDPNSEEILNNVINTLKENPQIEIEIRGHTDNTGSYNRNMKLSKDRAESVKAFLVKGGIQAERIKTQGFGPDKPVAPNDNKEGRAKNRRIEFFRIK